MNEIPELHVDKLILMANKSIEAFGNLPVFIHDGQNLHRSCGKETPPCGTPQGGEELPLLQKV